MKACSCCHEEIPWPEMHIRMTESEDGGSLLTEIGCVHLPLADFETAADSESVAFCCGNPVCLTRLFNLYLRRRGELCRGHEDGPVS